MQYSGATLDIAIVGGGITGLALAGLLGDLRRPDGEALSICLLEGRPPGPPTPEPALRVSAISPASHAVLATLGVWDQLPPDRVSPYERMCVWQAGGKPGERHSISFAAAEVGTDVLGYIIENHSVRWALWQRLAASPAITLLTDCELTRAAEEADACVLECADGRSIRARLLVGADGAGSWTREQLSYRFVRRDYEQVALVARIGTAVPHAATAWQRFLPSGPVAMLPLADGSSSLVWSCPTAEAERLRQLEPGAFAAELRSALDDTLGELSCLSTVAGFPLAMGYAPHYSTRRSVLIGDAAHRVHPLAGQGVNLGLLDAAQLAAELAAHLQLSCADPGDPLVLRRYERARKGDNMLTMGAMDAINRVFGDDYAGLGELGGLGLDVVDRLTPLKRRFATYAMGQGRDLPVAARSR